MKPKFLFKWVWTRWTHQYYSVYVDAIGWIAVFNYVLLQLFHCKCELWTDMLAYSGCSWIWREAKQRRSHDISILGQWPHYTKKQSISHADLLDLPHCALGKTINVKQLCSTPGPHKWDSLLGYRDNSSPSPERKWKALYPWDMINSQQAWWREEKCLYSACLEGRTPLHSITFQPAFCLLSRRLTEQQTFCHCLIRSQAAIYMLYIEKWLVITEM